MASQTKIRSETTKVSAQIKKLASKIASQQKTKKSLQTSYNSVANKLSNNSTYNKAQSSYNNYKEQISKLEDKYKKLKSKSSKESTLKEINSLKAKKKSQAEIMRSTASKNGFSSLNSKKTKLQANIDSVNKQLKSLSSQKSKATAKKTSLKNQLRKLQQAQLKKKNSPIISKKVKEAQKNGLSPMYRTDMQESTVFSLIETSPTESVNNNVATNPTDSGNPQTNYISRDSKELSGTYFLQCDTYDEAEKQYDKLQAMSSKYEFTILGFSHLKHVYIETVSKTVESSYDANALSLSLTFKYANQAKIQYSKNTKKKTTKTKASTKKTSGKSKSSKKYITVKAGMTYSSIANKTGTSLKKIMSMNKYPATKIPIGAKVRYK